MTYRYPHKPLRKPSWARPPPTPLPPRVHISQPPPGVIGSDSGFIEFLFMYLLPVVGFVAGIWAVWVYIP